MVQLLLILFGMTINNEESLTKIDASQYDVIVFDEIYFVDICKLSKIKNFVDNNKDKINKNDFLIKSIMSILVSFFSRLVIRSRTNLLIGELSKFLGQWGCHLS